MFKSKVLFGFVLICYILFAIYEISGDFIVSFYYHALIVPSLTVFYIFFINPKNKFFLLFLICFSIPQILGSILTAVSVSGLEENLKKNFYDIEYYISNTFFVLAYIFLSVKIIKSINFRYILRSFTIHIVVLIVLDCYLLYVLHSVINPNLAFENDYYLEVVYNIVILSLLSFALLNFLYRDNKKSLYLFLGVLFVVFSEVIDVAYIYVTERSILRFVSTTLSFVAFYFFFQQTTLRNDDDKDKFVFMN